MRVKSISKFVTLLVHIEKIMKRQTLKGHRPRSLNSRIHYYDKHKSFNVYMHIKFKFEESCPLEMKVNSDYCCTISFLSNLCMLNIIVQDECLWYYVNIMKKNQSLHPYKQTKGTSNQILSLFTFVKCVII